MAKTLALGSFKILNDGELPLLKMAQDGVRTIKRVKDEVGDGVSKFAAKSAEKAQDGVRAVKNAKKAVGDGVLNFTAKNADLITGVGMAVKLVSVLGGSMDAVGGCEPIDFESLCTTVKDAFDWKKKYSKKAKEMAGKGMDKLKKALCDALEKKGVDVTQVIAQYDSADPELAKMSTVMGMYAANKTGIDVVGITKEISKEISENKALKAIKSGYEKVKTFASENKTMKKMGEMIGLLGKAAREVEGQLDASMMLNEADKDLVESLGGGALDAAEDLAKELNSAPAKKASELTAGEAKVGAGQEEKTQTVPAEERTSMRQALGEIKAESAGKNTPAVPAIGKNMPQVV